MTQSYSLQNAHSTEAENIHVCVCIHIYVYVYACIIYMYVCVGAKLFQLCLTLCDLSSIAHQAPLPMGFRNTAHGILQEYWSGLPCTSFFFSFKFYFIFKLYIIVLVLPNIKMNPPQAYMCSPS